MLRLLLFLPFLLLLTSAFSQSFNIHCPLNNGVMKEQQGAYRYDKGGDWKIIVTSKSDSIVRAGMNGTVSNVAKGDGNTFDVVIFQGNYYLWYAGVRKPIVQKGQTITAGDVLGSYKKGDELEVMLFYFEAPMDVRKYLRCAKGK
jgi:murein DD-endopeptidase MepM/ murein hydrolase activator NlpD